MQKRLQKTMKKLILDFSDFATDLDNIAAFAIISSLTPPYKLAYILKKAFAWDFKRINDYNSFALSIFIDEVSNLQYSIIANKNTNGIFLKKQASLDYILLITGCIAYVNMDAILLELASIESFFLVDVINVKDYNELGYFYEDMQEEGIFKI